MNQEQNNLNSNNFNTQGNNGIPNNQPFQNTQNVNNTYIQPQQLNPNMSNQTTNQLNMGQSNTYQQPINQVNMNQNGNFQQSIQQPVQINNHSNNEQPNNKPKRKNLGLIISIVVAVIVIAIIVLIFLSKTNKNTNIQGDNPSSDSENNTSNSEQEDYEAGWNDYTVYIHGVEFTFPMSFEDFEKKIAMTKYKLRNENDREKTIYSSLYDGNQLEYIYQVREYKDGQFGLAYSIYIYLQNLDENSQPAYNTTVIGVETETISPYVDMDERGFDTDLYFTKKKLHIGQTMTKSQLEKTFGRGNSWIDGDNKYGAGNYTSGFYKFAKFQCNMNSDNRITKLIVKNVIKK